MVMAADLVEQFMGTVLSLWLAVLLNREQF